MPGYEDMQKRQFAAVDYLSGRLAEVKEERDLARHQVVTLTENTHKLEKEIERLKEQKIEWVDAWDCKHTLSIEVATRVLKQFMDEWPGGFEEIEACWQNWRDRAIKLGWKQEEE